MKNALIVFTIIFFLCMPSVIAETRVPVDINALELQAYQDTWENDGFITFEIEGINISIESKLTKLLLSFQETIGRDVAITIRVPKEFMPPSAIGLIESTDENTTIEWRTTNNHTIISFDLDALQRIDIEISKLDLAYGKVRKSVHDFWNYVEYNGDSDGTSDKISICIDKNESQFEMDNRHIIVQYKTSFFGWYYPVDEITSNNVYYNVEDTHDNMVVTTTFKDGVSGDVRVTTFPGASEGIINTDTLRGGIAKFVLKVQIGIKRFIIDTFGDNTPSYE